ncbi:MAG TPA: TonB-dependent receptor [Dinghuibacter sp.]|uniref:SusC/RagA family TonB-linked outer membrane protein n=1 Tax=Dinghuibacter sp. TaxID=2024697 RepID=UPI002BC15198|nr:TonB-dependent receptor [Dinghuibacter sp.]HTJ13387.1 TonB-dependent receptor [Dinghuibacter sp.]
MTKTRLLRKGLLLPFLLALAFLVHAQTKPFTGSVHDDKGNPVAGASVLVKGKKTGTTTDAQGNFSLTLPAATRSIQVSYVGYESQEIAVTGRVSVEVSLVPTQGNLNEVVVVGYGTQKRKDVTGSVSSVRGNSFKDQPVTNVTAALQGRAAGVEVVSGSGAPDATPTIIIRGVSSLHQPAPLYIVDGVRVPGDNINIQDIASVDVLKDASATAIYGSAAAGGVIVITTKKGLGGKPAITFSARYGVVKPKLVHLLDKNGFIKLEDIVAPKYFTGATQLDTLPNTDWVKALYSDGREQNYNLSVSGSTPVVNYLFSGFYNDAKGVYLDNASSIGGARVNTDFKLANWFKIGEQLSVSQRKTSPPVPGRNDLGYHNAPFRSLPIIPVYNKDGSWGTAPPNYNGFTFSGPNPVGAIENATTQNVKNNFNSNVYAEVKLPLYLTFRANLGYDYYLETQDYFQNAFNYGPGSVQTFNSLNKYYIESTQLLQNYVLTFDHTFGKHSINAVAGYEQITNDYNTENATMTSTGLPGFSFIQTSASNISLSGYRDPQGLIQSQFGRLNYNYDGRYYISGSIRQDANYTVFGPNKQKGVFSAASVGWNISDENFFKALTPVVNNLKLRGSYGTMGNSAIPPYTYTATYSQFTDAGGLASGGQNFAPGAPLVIANTFNAIPNPNLHWETVTETNVGLDGEAFKGKLYFSVEWYNKKTSNMLYALTLPLSSGFTAPYFVNIGSVNSKGIDLLVGYKDNVGGLGYDVTFTAGFNKNKVTTLDGITNDALYDGYNYLNYGDQTFNIMPNLPVTITKAGLPFGSFYGYKVTGMFKTDAQASADAAQPNAHAGDLIFAHDGKTGTTINPNDRQVIGNPNPKMVYGVNIRLNYKNFDLAALFNGVAGVQLFNGVKAYEQFPYADGNTTGKVFGDSFLGSNGLTSQPRLGVANTSNNTFALDPNGNYTTVNSYFVENGGYLKLKNLQIGYTFSNPLFSKAGIKGARVFVMANNLFTITKYTGLDPEVGSGYSAAAQSGFVGNTVGVTTRGIDAVPQYPQTRIYSAGLDVNF